MTFEQFQATRRWVEDVSEAGSPDWEDSPCPGFLYEGNLRIFASAGGAAPSVYAVLMGTTGKASSDLESLERDLYQYGIDDGLLEQD
jgi:hypothetical protein